MNYQPDFSSSDEDGLSDDNAYYEHKERIKQMDRENRLNRQNQTIDPVSQLKILVYQAICDGSKEVITNAIENDFDMNTRIKDNWTPVLLAASYGHSDVLKLLLQNKANVDLAIDGKTALMFASEKKDFETDICDRLACASVLLEFKADPDLCDQRRKTAIMYAANNGNLDIVKLLLPITKQMVKDNQSWTALFWAVQGNHIEIVQYLLDCGYNSHETDFRGQTAREIAEQYGYTQIAELLSEIADDIEEQCVSTEYFEDCFQSAIEPTFLSDIKNLLDCSRSTNLVPLFRQNGTTLRQYLALNDLQLESLGVQLPYQRSRILSGIFKHHKHPYNPKSLIQWKKNQKYTNVDAATQALTIIKQLMSMSACFEFVAHHVTVTDDPSDVAKKQEILELLSKIRRQLHAIQSVSVNLQTKVEKWDTIVEPVDRVTDIHFGRSWYIISTLVITTSALLLGAKLKKSW